MAAFSYQCHPLLVDSTFIPNTLINMSSSGDLPHKNTSAPPAPPHFHLLQDPITSSVDQSSKVTISHADPYHSPETSMVVDNLETGEQQVTQKVPPVDKKRRTRNGSSFSSSQSKDSTEGRNKKQKKSNGGVKGEDKPKEEKEQKKGPEEPPTGYIHVRARRGQATDSHSLAERVRREKISDRMKMLQQIVPGCDRVTGKALILDEIINYVQSLQNQVEFLSMKLASVNPMFFDLAMDLDTLMIRPEKLNSMESPSPLLPSIPQCSPNQATNFADTTTLTPSTTSSSIPSANDYILDYASSVFLQGQSSDVFSEFWDVEDQRQKFLHPYGSNPTTTYVP